MKPWLLALVAFAFAVVVGCGAPAHLEVPTLREAGVATCDAAKDPLHPLVVEWTADDRTQLEAALQRGPVIVSYEGCNLRILRACTARDAGHYDVVATTPAEQRIEIATTADLYANLPLSVATLEAKLARSGGLSLTYVAVGQRSLSGSPTLLDGDCEGASHFVDAMVLGAFELTARAAGGGSAKIEVVHAAAGGDAEARRELGGSAGDVALCKKQGLAAGASCQAVLSLALSPIRRVSRIMPVDTSLPSLAVIPDLGNQQAIGKRDALARVDVRLLELLERARKLDGDAAAPSRAKASAWQALAAHAGADAYRASAEKRRDDWLRIAGAEEASRARILARCPDYHAAKAKLDRLLSLDEVIAPEEKAHAQRTFDEAYGAWKKELDSCPVHGPAPIDGMVAIAGGSFVMGAERRVGQYLNYGDSDDVGPPHRVAVADFSMDVTEVTIGAYRRCVAARACTAPSGWPAKDDLPVSSVDREQARAYCAWAKKRLPTEEEWEYAARGMDAKEAGLSTRACWDRERRSACPVASRPASVLGLFDMMGNVWEWTDSPYTANYASELVSNLAVIRGGAYSSPVPEMLDVAYRGAIDPHRRERWVGFRCAR